MGNEQQPTNDRKLSRRDFLKKTFEVGSTLAIGATGVGSVFAQEGTPTPRVPAPRSVDNGAGVSQVPTEVAQVAYFEVKTISGGGYQFLATVSKIDLTEFELSPGVLVKCTLMVTSPGQDYLENPEIIQIPLVIVNEQAERVALGITTRELSLFPDLDSTITQAFATGGGFSGFNEGAKISIGFDVADRGISYNDNQADSSLSVNAVAGEWLSVNQTSARAQEFKTSKSPGSLARINNLPTIVPFAVTNPS